MHGYRSRGGNRLSKFSKFAERLLFTFIIILSRIRGQMEETGGVDNSRFWCGEWKHASSSAELPSNVAFFWIHSTSLCITGQSHPSRDTSNMDVFFPKADTIIISWERNPLFSVHALAQKTVRRRQPHYGPENLPKKKRVRPSKRIQCHRKVWHDAINAFACMKCISPLSSLTSAGMSCSRFAPVKPGFKAILGLASELQTDMEISQLLFQRHGCYLASCCYLFFFLFFLNCLAFCIPPVKRVGINQTEDRAKSIDWCIHLSVPARDSQAAELNIDIVGRVQKVVTNSLGLPPPTGMFCD